MFNEITYEELLNRSLNRVSSGVDASEGSMLYDAIAPCVAELYEAYLYIYELEKRVFADTAYDEYLEMRCAERGIHRKLATYAVRKGAFNSDIPIGSRWAKEELVYKVTSKVEEGSFLLQCETAGTIGNRYDGELVNMDAIENITEASLCETVIVGEENEADEQLRTRYFNSFENEAFGGNIADYKEKVGGINGVGQVKVYPVWNGGGTVKILLLDAHNGIPTSEFIDIVQSKVDPIQNQGQGLGLAPIGHVVTVNGAESVDVHIATALTFKNTSWDDVQPQVNEAIENYFNGLREKWNENDIVVRISQIEARLLDIEGIIDIEGTTLNGSTGNLHLNDSQVPKFLGVINNEIV